jgi:WD40 repeat protein
MVFGMLCLAPLGVGAEPAYPTNVLVEFDTVEATGAFAFSKNGEILIAAGGVKKNDEYVLLRRDLKRNVALECVRTSLGTYVDLLDRSPDGKSLLAVDGQGNVAVFAESGREIAKFRLFEPKLNRLVAVKFLNDTEILTVSRESVIERRSFRTGLTKLYYLSGRAPAGATIATGADALAWVNDRTVCLWKPMLREDSDPIEVFSPDNRYDTVICSDNAATVLCGGDYSELALYDMKKRKLIKSWSAHERETLAGLVSIRQRQEFLSVSVGGEIKVWSAAGDLVAATSLGEKLVVYGIASNDNSTLLAVGTRNRVFVVDLKALVEKKAEPK